MMASRLKIWEVNCALSLYQDVPHGFDVPFSIIWEGVCFISARVRIIKYTSCAKTNSGVTGTTVILLVSRDADPCFGMTKAVSHCIESFLIAVALQWGPWTNQPLPRFTTQWGGAVFPISDQWEQWVGVPVDDNELERIINLHTEADLGEGCAPVGW